MFVRQNSVQGSFNVTHLNDHKKPFKTIKVSVLWKCLFVCRVIVQCDVHPQLHISYKAERKIEREQEKS